MDRIKHWFRHDWLVWAPRGVKGHLRQCRYCDRREVNIGESEEHWVGLVNPA